MLYYKQKNRPHEPTTIGNILSSHMPLKAKIAFESGQNFFAVVEDSSARYRTRCTSRRLRTSRRRTRLAKISLPRSPPIVDPGPSLMNRTLLPLLAVHSRLLDETFLTTPPWLRVECVGLSHQTWPKTLREGSQFPLPIPQAEISLLAAVLKFWLP